MKTWNEKKERKKINMYNIIHTKQQDRQWKKYNLFILWSGGWVWTV